MRAPTMLRKKVTAHYAAVPVGARIARPRFVQNLLFAQLLQNQEIQLFFHLRKGLFSPFGGRIAFCLQSAAASAAFEPFNGFHLNGFHYGIIQGAAIARD